MKFGRLSLFTLVIIALTALTGSGFLTAATNERPVHNSTINASPDLHPAFTMENKSYGYIDGSGKFVIPQTFLRANDFNANGYAVVTASSGKQGLIDKTGNYLIKPAYQFTSDFSSGTSVFVTSNHNTYKEGLIDCSGKIIIPANYDQVNDYSEGIAVAQTRTHTKPGEQSTSYAFDGSGKLIFKCSGALGSFHDGLAIFTDNISQLYGYVDESGKVVIEPQYRYAEDFNDGKAEVSTQDDRYYDIDKAGKVLDTKSNNDLNYQYTRFDDGYYIKSENGNDTLYNKSGNAVIHGVSYIQRVNASHFVASKDPQGSILLDYSNLPTAFFDCAGHRLTGYQYYNVCALENGEISVVSKNQTYLLDENLTANNHFNKLPGYWALSLSGNLIKAVLYNTIRYYTQQCRLVFQGDGTFALNGKAKLACVLYTPYMYTNIVYPQISALNSKSVQNMINRSLKKDFTAGKLSTKSNAEDFTFEQISNILHIQANGYEGLIGLSMGAPKQIKMDYYFNLNTGAQYTLRNLFKKGSDYKKHVNKSLKCDIYINNKQTKLTVDTLTGFTVLKDGIQLYYVINSAAGRPPYVCNLSYKQLDKYIDKTSDLWKNISAWT